MTIRHTSRGFALPAVIMALVILAVLISGCSAFMSDLPAGWKPSDGKPKCSSSKAAPIVDTVIAVPTGVVAVLTQLAVQTWDPSENVGTSCSAAVKCPYTLSLVSTIAALWYGLAAYRGFGRANKCLRGKKEYLLRGDP